MQIVLWCPLEKKRFENAKEKWGTPVAYEQSWLYICQALRKGGWVCVNENGWGAVAKDYLGPGRHALVVPMSDDVPNFIEAVLTALRYENIELETIKHITEKDIAALIGKGAVVASENNDSTFHGYLEEYSEDRFPQVVIDISDKRWVAEGTDCASWLPSMPSGGRAGDFRYQVRRFCRLYLKKLYFPVFAIISGRSITYKISKI